MAGDSQSFYYLNFSHNCKFLNSENAPQSIFVKYVIWQAPQLIFISLNILPHFVTDVWQPMAICLANGEQFRKDCPGPSIFETHIHQCIIIGELFQMPLPPIILINCYHSCSLHLRPHRELCRRS